MFSEKALLTILLVVASVPISSAQGTFSNTGNMNTARYRHTAVLLPSGQVLVAEVWTLLQTPSPALSCIIRPPGRGQ
jgi:hypothetical protein